MMTLKRYAGPPDGYAILQREIGRRLPQPAHLATRFHAGLQPTAAVPSLPPIPGYYLPPDALGDGAPLTKAMPSTWLFPVMLGDVPALVDICPLPDQSTSSYDGYNYGVLARRVRAALLFAEEKFGDNHEEYQPRLLEISSLQLTVLWLAGPTDYFILVLDGRPLECGPFQILDDIVPTLRSEAVKVARARARSDEFLRTHPEFDSSSPTN